MWMWLQGGTTSLTKHCMFCALSQKCQLFAKIVYASCSKLSKELKKAKIALKFK